MVSVNKVIDKVKDIFSKSLVKDSIWMLLSQGSSIVIQSTYFVIVVRVLGFESYGKFVGIASLVSVVFPFVGFGSSDIFVKNVARDPKIFRGYWGTAILVSLLFAFAFIPITLVAARIFFPDDISLLLVFLILLADLVGLKIWQLASSAFISVDSFKLVAQTKIIYGIGKLLAAVALLVFFKDANALTWGYLYCIGSILPALVSLIRVNRLFGNPIFNLRKYPPELYEGFFFAIALSAETVNLHIDKTMLVSLASPEVAGIYAAGYRFIDVCYLVVIAVLGTTYTRFLRHGASGIRNGLKFARQLVPVAVGYGLLSAIALLSIAPFISIILGETYVQSASILRWLSPILLVATLQFIAADTLTGAGFHKIRSVSQVIAAALNIGMNLYLIPRFSWHGAIWATLMSETFKMITLWILVFFYSNREKTQEQLVRDVSNPKAK